MHDKTVSLNKKECDLLRKGLLQGHVMYRGTYYLEHLNKHLLACT